MFKFSTDFCNHFLIINSLLVIPDGMPFTCKTELNLGIKMIMKDLHGLLQTS